MDYLHGKFVWFEHLSNDLSKARAFYEGLFGWTVEEVTMGPRTYPMIKNDDTGIGGFRSAPPGVPNHWTSYLSVADVDACAKSVRSAGGSILMEPVDFGPVGRGAAVADPTGSVFCIWKGTQGDPPDPDVSSRGNFCWNECWTPDEHKALAFYERVFGFSHEAITTDPQHTYYLLKKHGMPRAGLARSVRPGTPAMWLPYVAVNDCDGTAARATPLGGKELMPPTDIPNIGRFAIVMDSTGAPIAMLQPKI